jgi:hypothetical protein
MDDTRREKEPATPATNPFPSVGETLFSGQGTVHDVAYLDLNHHPWPTYIKGYLTAAHSLAEQAMEDRGDRDSLICPILSLYRLHVEIALRELQSQIGRLTGGPGPTSGQRLASTWALVRPVLAALEAPPRDLDRVEKLIAELERNEPRSLAFRILEKSDGSNPAEGSCWLNIEHLKDTMTKLSDFLEASSNVLDAELERRRERSASEAKSMADYGQEMLAYQADLAADFQLQMLAYEAQLAAKYDQPDR